MLEPVHVLVPNTELQSLATFLVCIRYSSSSNSSSCEGLNSPAIRNTRRMPVSDKVHSEALRNLAGVHIGKVMIDVTPSPEAQHTNNCLGPKKTPAPANGHESQVSLPPIRMQPTVHFRPDRSYIITGGLGGFGQAVFEFLVAYGANNIVITSKRGVRNGNQQIALQTMFNNKINVSNLPFLRQPQLDKLPLLSGTSFIGHQ